MYAIRSYYASSPLTASPKEPPIRSCSATGVGSRDRTFASAAIESSPSAAKETSTATASGSTASSVARSWRSQSTQPYDQVEGTVTEDAIVAETVAGLKRAQRLEVGVIKLVVDAAAVEPPDHAPHARTRDDA